jgi:hypothetical protein
MIFCFTSIDYHEKQYAKSEIEQDESRRYEVGVGRYVSQGSS